MDVAVFEAALHRERAETLLQRERLCRDRDDIFAAAADVATDDEHDPEGATIAYERSRTTSLLQQVEAHLGEISLALARLHAGTYGTCLQCGAAIGIDRLQARPAVRTCITCASG